MTELTLDVFQDAYRVCIVEADTQITKLEDAAQTMLLGGTNVSISVSTILSSCISKELPKFSLEFFD